ncbi:ATP-binding protein [Salinibius halmophilus]|uniref:ATP-binding protein n=1 Tax=Salinibius halmophilus TaxID=1853216 RepID=UPI0013140777|nr:ATP-binding protein [Salinibius halmophilus]
MAKTPSKLAEGKAITSSRRNSTLSLTLRVTLGAGVSALLALIAVGVLLVFLFSQYIERRFEQTLSGKVLDLIATVDASVERINIESTNPAFRSPISGWYWLIIEQPNVIATSPSLVGGHPPMLTALTSDGWHTAIGPGGNQLRVLRQTIMFEEANRQLTFVVSGPQSDISQDVWAFSRQAAISLLVFLAALVAVVWLQTYLSLRPVTRMTAQLSNIRSGQQSKLAGEYPKELQQIGDEINLLIDHSEQVVERGRLQAANIAHSLKTPLAVMNNEMANLPDASAKLLRQQLKQLDQTVQLYLARAQTSRKLYVSHQVNVQQSVAELVNAVSLAYPDKQVVVNCEIDAKSTVLMEQGDFDELVANLIDNAIKWTDQKVLITFNTRQAGWQLTVEDDGPGIPNEQLHKVTRVGVRLDESVPGSGVGLAIVQDILAVYRSRLTFSTSQALGGNCARIECDVG